jgi:succinyl-diaminopimelate desuccinylase
MPPMRVDRTLELAMELIRQPSVTPHDAGCQDLLIEHLEPLGFEISRLKFGEVDNFWAQRGDEGPVVVFAGHTDVVPTGPRGSWDSDPFTPQMRDGYLYGRGAADMKSSLAAFVTAIATFVSSYPRHRGSIALLITSDEEGVARDGTVKVVEWLSQQGKTIDYCIVGEPCSEDTLGDVIKNGRRGSLNGRLSVRGMQGHIAYPHLARNPIHLVAPALAELVAIRWDDGHENFPPTSFQVSNIAAGTGADNVIPGTLELEFNFRYSPALTDTALRERVEQVLQRHELDYSLSWRLSGEPFLTPAGRLVDAARAAIRSELSLDPTLSTAGGTSDGRFIARTGAQVVELGPVNASIHQVNERIRVADLAALAKVYTRMLAFLLESV